MEYYVAPYEADAQLTYLYLKKKVSVVITEDSDLLPFGVNRVFFKMDRYGDGVEIDMANLKDAKELNFRSFTDEMFLVCCILSGCDYLESIKGIGLKTAHRIISENGSDRQTILKRIRRDGKYLIPKDYEKQFEKAFLTFKF